MKRVVPVRILPGKFESFRQSQPDERSWDALGRRVKRELKRALISAQRGLCAYCEQRLNPNMEREQPDDHSEIEHFHPKSDRTGAFNWTFEPTNLLACCLGGRHTRPVDLSCGAKKGDQNLDDTILKPAALPDFPSIFVVNYLGKLEVDRRACLAAQVDPQKAENTIAALGLNCTRLVNRRKTVWVALLLDQEVLFAEDGRAREALLFDELPRALPAFFTTCRSFLGFLAEDLLESNAAWRTS